MSTAVAVFVGLTSGTSAQSNAGLSRQIDAMYAEDQRAQVELKNAIEARAPMGTIQGLEAQVKQTFDRHVPALKNIIATSGYPTTAVVGKESSAHFFVLVQHADSDPSFQSSLLPVLSELSLRGEIGRREYAYLYDRVRLNLGQKQLYGTQLSFGPNGSLFDDKNAIIVPVNLEDPGGVDRRREEMGMEPLERYYETVLKALGRPRVGTPR